MASTSSIALSGMQAAQTQMGVAAHNIANLGTAGFKRQESVQTQESGGGVTASVKQTQVEGAALEADIVSQLQAKHAFIANLAVFKTSNKMAGALLDKTA
jgi:flagellar hook protein FlgE